MNLSNDNLRVLVAEGSEIVRKRLCHLVEETAGLTLAGEAEMAVEAYLFFASRKPDAAIISVNLPDTSGLQLLRRIKETSPHCLVVMLCDEMKEEYRAICARFGADHLFHKATEFEQAAAVLARAAEEREIVRSAKPRWLREPLSCETSSKKP